jgi:phosphoribosyl-ATP pyrophosphohydrolase
MNTSERIISSPDFAQLSNYENWAAQNWLYQPGSDNAQQHARAKLDEEAVELIDAITLAIPEDIISEAGDVLWTAHASGSNTGISISRALTESYPTIFNVEHIPTALIDELARAIFHDASTEEMQNYLSYQTSLAAKSNEQWFRLSPIAKIPFETFTDALIASKRERAVAALATTTLATSFVIQEFASSTLQDAMKDNYQKIEQRIVTGARVAKPPRSQ